MTEWTVGTLVIGAGVIGASLAAELQRSGEDVAVVEAEIPGAGVSGSSFAWVNSSSAKTPLTYRRLNLAGLEAHHRLRAEGRASWFHPVGSLALPEPGKQLPSPPGDAEIYDDLDGHAPRELLDSMELSRRHPYLSDQVHSATHYPRDGWIDVPRMVREQLSTLPADRVRTSTPVCSLSSRKAGPHASATLADGTTISAERVVIAAGLTAPALVEQVAPGLELLGTTAEQTQVGMTVETFPVDTLPTTVLLSDGLSMRPNGNGGVVIADHATAAQHEISDPAIWTVPEALLDRARVLVPGIGAIRPRTVHISPRVWPRDGRTVVGWIADGVYTVLTHSGITLAQFMAESVREELAGRTVLQLDEFRPDRFLEVPRS